MAVTRQARGVVARCAQARLGRHFALLASQLGVSGVRAEVALAAVLHDKEDMVLREGPVTALPFPTPAEPPGLYVPIAYLGMFVSVEKHKSSRF